MRLVPESVFSPPGDEVLFTSRADGPAALFRIPVAGGTAVPADIDRTGDLYSDWSKDGRANVFDARDGDRPPDGDRIAFTSTRSVNLDVWTMSADGTEPVRRTTRDRF